MAARRVAALVFDLDGTLVDSVYQHVLAWHRALLESGIELSVWRIHRRIGMSGGLFARALLRETGRDLDAGFLQQLQDAPRRGLQAARRRRTPAPGDAGAAGPPDRAGLPLVDRDQRPDGDRGAHPRAARVPKSVPIVTRDQVERAKPDPDCSWRRSSA